MGINMYILAIIKLSFYFLLSSTRNPRSRSDVATLRLLR
jgi:hypothetical protein